MVRWDSCRAILRPRHTIPSSIAAAYFRFQTAAFNVSLRSHSCMANFARAEPELPHDPHGGLYRSSLPARRVHGREPVLGLVHRLLHAGSHIPSRGCHDSLGGSFDRRSRSYARGAPRFITRSSWRPSRTGSGAEESLESERLDSEVHVVWKNKSRNKSGRHGEAHSIRNGLAVSHA